MSPEYFHTRLTYGEADDYLGGMHRRYHAGYDQARMITALVGKLFAKDYKIPTFPWEKKETDFAPPTEEELAQIRREGEEWAAMLNRQASP